MRAMCPPAIMIVFEFPPKLSLSSQVSTESLYGMKGFFLWSPDASAMQGEKRSL